jgi:hypothetical protein
MDLIDFEWQRCIDGFRIDHYDEEPYDLIRHGGLESASSRFERYRPTEFPALFQQFADMPHSTKGMGDFANRFGLLEMGRVTPSIKHVTASTLVYPLLAHHRALCWAISRFEAGDGLALAHLYNEDRDPGIGWLRTELRLQSSGKLSLVFVPSSLIQFLWLQFALHVASGAKLLRCERCNLPFPCGSGTGRRETAKFCSNRCKVASFRKRTAATELMKGGHSRPKAVRRADVGGGARGRKNPR